MGLRHLSLNSLLHNLLLARELPLQRTIHGVNIRNINRINRRRNDFPIRQPYLSNCLLHQHYATIRVFPELLMKI